jgi:hypothetical protein
MEREQNPKVCRCRRPTRPGNSLSPEELDVLGIESTAAPPRRSNNIHDADTVDRQEPDKLSPRGQPTPHLTPQHTAPPLSRTTPRKPARQQHLRATMILISPSGNIGGPDPASPTDLTPSQLYRHGATVDYCLIEGRASRNILIAPAEGDAPGMRENPPESQHHNESWGCHPATSHRADPPNRSTPPPQPQHPTVAGQPSHHPQLPPKCGEGGS